MSTPVGELTLDELTAMIENIVDARLAAPLKPWYTIPMPADAEAYLEELQRNIVSTPDGVPTPSEMIAEERERWRSSSS